MADLSNRHSSILQIVKPLVKRVENLYVAPRNVSREEFVWVVVPSGTKLQGNPSEIRFRTKVSYIYATYFERWLRFYQGAEERWYLERSYLHFYQVDRSNRTAPEYLLLHCDPNETREHALYKQSPHLHIKTAPEPWPHAHIALNVGYLEPMLKDASSLTAAFGAAVLMLKEQLLDLMEEE